MLDLINDKWSLILDTLKKEHEILDVSFNTWIKPLKVHSFSEGILYIVVPDENISIPYINRKYYLPLKVTTQEILGENIDISFIHPNDNISTSTVETQTIKVNNSNNAAKLNLKMLEANLNPNYTFDNFVVGGNNVYAHAYALSVAESPATMYNPLFIYGGVGLGKTHLMHSIGNFILQKDDNTKVLCITSEAFTNEVINAIRSENPSSMVNFRNKYRNVDVLLIDDIQFIIGKERSQEEFFHTFNTLYEAKKQIIISSDKPPRDFSTLEERLRSRFEMGLTVDISAPDYETRMAILKKKAEIENYNINDEIFQYIATNVKSNIRELEGALTKVVAFSRVCKDAFTLDLVKNVLKDLISPETNSEITPELIIKIVAEHFNITVNDMSSKKKSQEIVFPRQIAMFLCRDLTDSSLAHIGSLFGKKDHSTVIHAIDKVKASIDTNTTTLNTIEVIKKKLLPS